MPHGQSDRELIDRTRNTARFFTENRQVAWVLLVGTLLWGFYAYLFMPKRRDPSFPQIYSAVVCPWIGASAERVEQFVTRKIEERLAENARVARIESTSRSNVSIVVVTLDERTRDTQKEYDDIALRLNAIRDLPSGAGPIEFIKDFGETAALLLTVTSPKVGGAALALRARNIRSTIERVRAGAPGPRATLLVSFPESIAASTTARLRDLVMELMRSQGFGRDHRPVDGAGFVGIDLDTDLDDEAVLRFVQQAIDERLGPGEFPPDVWRPAVIRDPRDTETRVAAVAGDKFTYRDLDMFTDRIRRELQRVPQVAKVVRAGVLPEQIFLDYSQERLASVGLPLTRLAEVLSARNITLPGGFLDVQGKRLTIDPSGEFRTVEEIGEVIVGTSSAGRPFYLRDGVTITRSYQAPRYVNYHGRWAADGVWQRTRAITLSVQMRPGEQIAQFGRAVDAALERVRGQLPGDLILVRTSDQPLQVRESVGVLMRSLYEAIGLIIIVAFVGFREWRSALLLAAAIPLTLAMTFGMMHVLRVDLQQVSIASLIIALGLLVDDPVVAGDAIRRALDAGHPRRIAAWLGPTRLATAILFATITNIVAYLPLLMVGGQIGDFIYTLPVVLACSLVASRIVSMTFVPLLGYYLLRPRPAAELSAPTRADSRFVAAYYRAGGWAIDHRWAVLGCAAGLLAGALLLAMLLRLQFFPSDRAYLSYIDVWLPEDATISATNRAAEAVEGIVRRVAADYGREHPHEQGQPRQVLDSVTTFVGGGSPRFYFSVAPQLSQPNYAQLIIKVLDKEDTGHLIVPLQRALSAGVPGARIDVRQLEAGKPVGIPVAVRVSGDNAAVLRRLAGELKSILQAIPIATRTRDDWGADSFKVKLQVDPDRANFAGVSNLDVALSSVTALSGFPVGTLREGDQQIPVVARLRMEERARLSDVQNLYVGSTQSTQRVPLRQVSRIEYRMETERIRRRNHFRTITVSAFPIPGVLASEVLRAARPALQSFERTLPPGYAFEIGGEQEEQAAAFRELVVVLAVSVAAIFLALVLQFRNAVKPLIVFSAIPFGVAGALVSLVVMRTPFGFMAFLGVASLIGVIVSHVIVLFDYIEEMHARGEPLRDALLDAGIVRLRPVLITVGATVFGLVPLALHGGPLWAGLCYAQIGGLSVATVVTLVLVPVLYAISVLDLKIVEWQAQPGE